MTCKHMIENPELKHDSRYVCSCGACHDEILSRIYHYPRYSKIENECTKCGAKWIAQFVMGS